MNNRQNVKDVKQDMEYIIKLYHNHRYVPNFNNDVVFFSFSYKEKALFFTFLSDILSVGIDRFSIHRGGDLIVLVNFIHIHLALIFMLRI